VQADPTAISGRLKWLGEMSEEYAQLLLLRISFVFLFSARFCIADAAKPFHGLKQARSDSRDDGLLNDYPPCY
jgi:hypothetical protein